MEDRVLLEANNVHKDYLLKRKSLFKNPDVVKAVRGVSFRLHKGETFGCVGESGCGKSTLSRLLIMLEKPTKGTIIYMGKDAYTFNRYEKFRICEKIQLVLQDPYLSLPSWMKIGDIIGDPLNIHYKNKVKKIEKLKKILTVMNEVGLTEDDYTRYPLSFSAGQRQMINIARAIILNPEIVILDEAVSALDVSVQATILNIFSKLRENRNLSYILIAHDIGVVKHMCDQISVMYLGKFVELGSNEDIFKKTLHPYTHALLNSVPTIEKGLEKKEVETLTGEVPSPINIPSGCTFKERCPDAMSICNDIEPEMLEVEEGHFTCCHLYTKK